MAVAAPAKAPPMMTTSNGAAASAVAFTGGKCRLRIDSWKVPFRFRARIGTMNPLATLARRGTDRARTNACSPPGRGWGWVGSWRAAFRFCACIGTMNREEAAAGPLASWTAAVLCRFCARGPDRKAPEDWENRTAVRDVPLRASSPKPGGAVFGPWRASLRFCAGIGTMNPPLTPPRRGSDRTRTSAGAPLPGGEISRCGRMLAPLLGGVGGGSVHGEPPFALAPALGP